MSSPTNLTKGLRDWILTSLHVGHLQAGDRLPSVRELARLAGVNPRVAMKTLHTLAEEGLIEVRDRSGAYIAPQERVSDDLTVETAKWLAGVLAEAWTRRIAFPHLPDLIRRCTATAHLRCALVESTVDHREVLVRELREDFGLDADGVSFDQIPEIVPGQPPDVDSLPEPVREADLLVTTTFHGRVMQLIADALGKPLVSLRGHPAITGFIERRLLAGHLVVVCADPRFGEWIRAVEGGRFKDRIEVLTADSPEAIAALDPNEPILITLAARRRLGEIPLPPVFPHSPSISPDSARELAEALIRLNIEQVDSEAGALNGVSLAGVTGRTEGTAA